MPGVTLHFLLADQVLSAWRRHTMAPPFDLDDPAALNAFYHGAVGPDLGYFPGGNRLLSDLAHCVRTGALTRRLISTARTVRERAFSWGWLTHYLADEAIHPIIGRGVGELLTGCRDCFVDGSSDMLTHLRVEMGLDAWHAERAPGVRERRLKDVFGPGNIHFLVRAYADTYEVAMNPDDFLHAHSNTTRRVGQALGTMRILAALMDTAARRVPWALRSALRAAYGRDALRSLGLAYLNPVHPSEWLVEKVGAAMREHVATFLKHYESGAATLRDVNLDTGRPLGLEVEHEGTRRGMAGLARLAAA
jgi:hypothetical protein